jgi:hypothetical protein
VIVKFSNLRVEEDVAMGTDAAEWTRLIDRLDEAIPRVAEDYLTEFAARGLYPVGAVSDEDLRATAEQTLRMLVHRLDDRGSGQTATDLVHSLGERRARQGVPLDTLTEAVRLDLLVIWRWLREFAGDKYTVLVADRFEVIFEVLDRYVLEVQTSFLREQAALERDSRRATERDLSRLFSSIPPTASVVERAASATGIDAAQRLDLAVFDEQKSGGALERIERAIASGAACTYTYDGALCVFWRHDTPPFDVASIQPVGGLLVKELDGLAQVPLVARTLRDALHALGPLEVLTPFASAWPAVVADHIMTVLPSFIPSALAGLDGTGAYERERLVTTVRSYMQTGSIKETAEAVFCHRNTVVNRLSTFTRLTGLDVTVPEQAALALVALQTIPD